MILNVSTQEGISISNKKRRPVSSIGRALGCKLGKLGSILWRYRSLSLWLIMKSFLRSFVLYLCFDMYRRYQFLAKMKATSTGKLLDILPRNDAVVDLCSGTFNLAYWRDSVCKLPTPPHHHHHHPSNRKRVINNGVAWLTKLNFSDVIDKQMKNINIWSFQSSM
jgi:hypothetical protein